MFRKAVTCGGIGLSIITLMLIIAACSVQLPTPVPTATPTPHPTPIPTATPTPHPTLTPTPAPLSHWYSCETLARDAVRLSQSTSRNSVFGLRLLKIYNPKRTVDTLTLTECEGEARWSNGDRDRIVVHAEKDSDGDIFTGYRPLH